MSVPVSKDLLLINAAAFLRSFTFGLTGVVLGIYLFRVGLSSFNIGMVVATGLVGSALATIGVTAKADRTGRRWTLMALSLLGAIRALALAFTSPVPVLLVMAFVGMLNGTGTDRSAAFTLEQAIIPGLVPDASRTWGLAWYNVVLDTAGSLGALAAGLPLLLQRWLAIPLLASYRTVFLGCAFLGVVGAVLYAFASAAVEVSKSATEDFPHHISPATKKVVTKLAGLFSLDAFGGGFLTDALVAYWFFRRFGVAEESLGVLFSSGAPAECCLSCGGRVVGSPRWAREHDGLYSSAFQLVFDRCGVRTFGEVGNIAVPVPRSTRRDGRPHTPILRVSRGSAARAYVCERYRESGAQYFLGRRFVHCGLFDAERGFFGSLGDRRRGQDRLRRTLVSCLSKAQTTGRALEHSHAQAKQTATRSRQAGSRFSMSSTPRTALGLVCPVGYDHLCNRPFRRWARCKNSPYFIRFNNTRRPIERTGLARCASNETYTAGAKTGATDTV